MENKEKQDGQVYRRGRLTILELMSVLAILGGLLTWVLQRFFAN